MAKLVLVDNFFCQRVRGRAIVDVVPHLGLMSLAAVLEDAGHDVAILDPKILFGRDGHAEPDEAFMDAWAEALSEARADIVGFTAYGVSFPYVVRVAERLRRHRPEQIIVLGGPHATILAPEILEAFACFDAIVRYEAESLVVPLVEALMGRGDVDDVPNVVHRRQHSVTANRRSLPIAGVLAPIARSTRATQMPDVNAMGAPALHFYPIEEIGLTHLAIEAGRGCPFTCTFCSTSEFFHRRYRVKTAARMAEEMRQIRARYGINDFTLNHDLFGLNRRVTTEFCNLIRDQGFKWDCSMRTDTVDAELLSDLSSAGCTHIYFGIESGSPELQRVIEKKLCLDDVEETVRTVVGNRLTCTASFITGFPEESDADQNATLDLIGRLLAVDPERVRVQLHILSPEPGSKLGRSLERTELDAVGPEPAGPVDLDLVSRYPSIFCVFRHFRSVVSRRRVILASAFVSELMQELGPCLVAHITHTRFAGSLSAFFAAVSQSRDDVQSWTAAVELLRAGIDAWIADLGAGRGELQELVRLGRIIHAQPKSVQPQRGTNTSGELRLVRFTHDIATLHRSLRHDHRKALRLNTAPTWCALMFDSMQCTAIHEVGALDAWSLVGTSTKDDLGAYSV